MWERIKNIELYEEKGKNFGLPKDRYVMEVVIGDRREILTVPEVEKLAECLDYWVELMRKGNHYPYEIKDLGTIEFNDGLDDD